MARPRKERKVYTPPRMEGFEPYGISGKIAGEVCLKYEEFESIRLVSYEGLSQAEAADRMDVSRPTLTRIYNRALRIMARALVEGRSLKIDGGDFTMQKEWYRCRKCSKLIEGIENHIRCEGCKDFGPEELRPIFLQ